MMKRDENTITVGLGVSSADSSTPTPLKVDTITDYLLIDISSDSLSPTVAIRNKRDQNQVPTKYGVSNVDGVTLVPIRTDSAGRLLITL
jgi:hypothetical protein